MVGPLSHLHASSKPSRSRPPPPVQTSLRDALKQFSIMAKEELSAKKLIKQSWIGQTERYEIASTFCLPIAIFQSY